MTPFASIAVGDAIARYFAGASLLAAAGLILLGVVICVSALINRWLD